MADTSIFQHPLQGRYASKAMKELWSDDRKFRLWRRIWIVIATLQKGLGLNISDEQIAEMQAHCDDINYEFARAREAVIKHDVLSHIDAFGEQCPKAKPIIHLGCTSCDVTDNAQLILIREGLILIERGLCKMIHRLQRFAIEYRALPTLGFTHIQPAQAVTVGKRAAMWMQDLVLDLDRLRDLTKNLKFRGLKGTTGTQASFLELFDGNHDAVKELDSGFAHAFGFEKSFIITGQTYSRKQDTFVLDTLAGIGSSLHKMAMDIRMLQHMKEIEEPFDEKQKGSSAMAYKRNPMRSERICGLSTHLMILPEDGHQTHAKQVFERTLDDSSNERISLPEAFLITDAILLIAQNVCEGLVVYEKTIAKHLNDELPFMATENIIAAMVKKGGDRQAVHERLRDHSMAAGDRVKREGLTNNLIELIMTDSFFAPIHDEMPVLMEPSKFIGRAVQQVDEFLKFEIASRLHLSADELGGTTKLTV